MPGVAPAAIQEAEHTARNIERALRGEPLLPFRYHDKGSLATIGRGRGIAQLGRFQLSGWIAWADLALHPHLLPDRVPEPVRRPLQWAWSYVTYDRGARLITGPLPRLTVAESTRSADAAESEVDADRMNNKPIP